MHSQEKFVFFVNIHTNFIHNSVSDQPPFEYTFVFCCMLAAFMEPIVIEM